MVDIARVDGFTTNPHLLRVWTTVDPVVQPSPCAFAGGPGGQPRLDPMSSVSGHELIMLNLRCQQNLIWT